MNYSDTLISQPARPRTYNYVCELCLLSVFLLLSPATYVTKSVNLKFPFVRPLLIHSFFPKKIRSDLQNYL